MSKLVRALVAGLLGAGAALLVSCSGSGKSLIPAASAGPLKEDFEAIAQAARSGQGSCTSTEAAIVKAEGDLAALPATVDRGLRRRLHEGLTKLREDALGLCARTTSSTTTTAPTTTSTQTTTSTPTQTETTPTQSTSTTNTATTPGPGGGTPAPREGEEGGEGPPEAASQSFKRGNGHEKGPKAHGDAVRKAAGARP